LKLAVFAGAGNGESRTAEAIVTIRIIDWLEGRFAQEMSAFTQADSKIRVLILIGLDWPQDGDGKG